MFLIDDQTLALGNSIFPLHISPVFSPFTKIGKFENTQSTVHIMVKEKGAGYIAADLENSVASIGGPHSVRIALIASTFGLPRIEAYGESEAAFSTIRYQFCYPYPSAQEVIISIVDRADRLLYQYTVSCDANL